MHTLTNVNILQAIEATMMNRDPVAIGNSCRMFFAVLIACSNSVGDEASPNNLDRASTEPVVRPAFMPEISFYRTSLSAQGVTVTRSGLSAYLRQKTRVTAAERENFHRFVNELGHDDFHTRDRATKNLVALGDDFHDELVKISRTTNSLEARIRAADVIRQTKRLQSIRPADALHIIAHDRIEGLTSEVLDILERETRGFVIISARRALEETATEHDVGLLRTTISETESDLVRVACLNAISKFRSERAESTLTENLTHNSDSTRLAAAAGLATHGNPAALDGLVQLLSSDVREIRFRASKILRVWQNRRFEFRPHARDDDRSAGVRRWHEFSAANSATKSPYRPVRRKGHVLATTKRSAIELDSLGQPIHEQHGFANLTDASIQNNGDFVFADRGDSSVVEFGSNWKTTSHTKFNAIIPFCARHLPNDDVIILGKLAGRSQLLLSSKKDSPVTIASSNATCLTPLGDGILIGGYNSLFELNKDGEILWKMQVEYTPKSVEVLENGQFLVVDHKQICIYEPNDPEPRLRCEHSGATSARALATGHILIGDEKGVKLICRNNRILWERKIRGSNGTRVAAF